MHNINKDSAKKTFRSLTILSTIAILLVGFMGSVNQMKSFAQVNGTGGLFTGGNGGNGGDALSRSGDANGGHGGHGGHGFNDGTGGNGGRGGNGGDTGFAIARAGTGGPGGSSGLGLGSGNGTGTGGNGTGTGNNTTCTASCFSALSPQQQTALEAHLNVGSLADLCLAIKALNVTGILNLVVYLGSANGLNLNASALNTLLACLNINIGSVGNNCTASCFSALTTQQQTALEAHLNVGSLADLCLAVQNLSVVNLSQLVLYLTTPVLLGGLGLSANILNALLACLHINLSGLGTIL